MAKLKLDLHDIYNRGRQIDVELNRIMQEAVDKRIELVEIIPGKGSGQLKKHVLRFLNQGHIRSCVIALRRMTVISGGFLCIFGTDPHLRRCILPVSNPMTEQGA